MKTLIYIMLFVFTISSSLVFAQEHEIDTDDFANSIRIGWASTVYQSATSIDAINLGLSFPMFYILKNKSLSIDWIVNGYTPVGNRDSLSFQGAGHFGIGLNYHLRIKLKNSLILSAYPIIAYNFYKGVANQFSFLATQWDVKLPLLYEANGKVKLSLGLSYVSKPLFYKESRVNYDFTSLYLSLQL